MPIQKITSGVIESNINITGNLSLDSTGTTGFRAPSANTLAFHTAGTEDMRIDSSGNVGIGSTTPGSFGKLVVKTSSTSEAAGLAVMSSANDSFLSIYNSGSVHSIGATYSSTGSYQPIAFVTSGSERMRIDTSGRVTKPFQPAFMAHTYSTNGSLIAGTYYTVLFTTVVTNRGNHYNAGSGVFTCPVAGDYYVHFNFNIRTTGNAWSSAFILKNNTQVIQSWSQPNADNQYDNCVVNCVLNCAANDTIIFGFHKDYDSPANSANYTHGSIYLLG